MRPNALIVSVTQSTGRGAFTSHIALSIFIVSSLKVRNYREYRLYMRVESTDLRNANMIHPLPAKH